MTDDRIVKDAIEGRRRIPPGVAPGPDPPGPHLAAGQGARQPLGLPRPAPSGADGDLDRRHERPDASPAPAVRGGRRPVRSVAGEARSRVDGRVCEAGRTSVGSRRRPSGAGGTVPTSISRPRARIEVLESSLERR